jgi:hypothetical protein
MYSIPDVAKENVYKNYINDLDYAINLIGAN